MVTDDWVGTKLHMHIECYLRYRQPHMRIMHAEYAAPSDRIAGTAVYNDRVQCVYYYRGQ